MRSENFQLKNTKERNFDDDTLTNDEHHRISCFRPVGVAERETTQKHSFGYRVRNPGSTSTGLQLQDSVEDWNQSCVGLLSESSPDSTLLPPDWDGSIIPRHMNFLTRRD